MTKVKEHLSNASIEIAKAVYYSAGSMETQDEKQLRYFMSVIPHIIERLEKVKVTTPA